MTFPTTPTTGANTLIVSSQATATTTHTFGSLTTLNNASGDLLLAIIVTYLGGSTNADFSSWGGGFTEFVDQSTNSATVQSIGAAYKFSDGTETGTFTVTSAGSTRSVMFLLSVKGAHASTVPEATARATGTTGAADPASLNPTNWDVEDTLWIAVGVNGETSLTGTFTGITAAPTNYTGYVDSGIIGGDVIGALEGALGFRQNAVAAEDVGGFTLDTGAAGNSALLIAVRPAPTIVTGVATGEFGFTASAIGGLDPYVDEFTALNPVLYLRLGESAGTTANDSSTNNLDGTYYDGYTLGVASGLGDGDTAVTFSRSGTGRVETAHHADLNLDLGAGAAWSIVFRYRQNGSFTDWPGVAMKGPQATGWGMYATDRMVFKANDIEMQTSAGAVVTDTWAHWVATYDGSNLRWYKDGALHTTVAHSTSFTSTNTDSLRLNGLDFYADATIDEFGIVRAVLTPSQVAVLAAAQTVEPELSGVPVMSPMVAPSRPQRFWR